MCLMK